MDSISTTVGLSISKEMERIRIRMDGPLLILELGSRALCFGSLSPTLYIKKKTKKQKTVYLRKGRQPLFRLHVFGFENLLMS